MASCAQGLQTAAVEGPLRGVPETRAFIDSVRRSLSIPGMAVTVVHGGSVIMREGFGMADVEAGIPATSDTKFRVGSVSKLFTAVALMRLAEGGLVDLDAPLSRYLDPYPKHWPELTLRKLAGHTGGVRHYRGAEFFSTKEYSSLRDAIGIFLEDTLRFVPGTRYAYSSYGFNLIGAVMESVSSESFPVLMQRIVFAPLQLTNTVPDSSGRTIEGRSKLYSVNADGVTATRQDNLSSRWPSGGYLSSTSDLARFASVAIAPGFLSVESIEQMFTPQRLTGGDTTTVGIGWRVGSDSAGRHFYHHGGTSNGGAAFLLVYPREALIIAIASNAFGTWSTPEALRVASFFLERIIPPAAPRSGRRARLGTRVPPPRPTTQPITRGTDEPSAMRMLNSRFLCATS